MRVARWNGIILLLFSLACAEEEQGSENVELREETRLLEQDPSFLSATVSEDELVLSFARPAAELAIAPGHVLVGAADSGYLRRVTEVRAEGNTLTVKTENASLTDAIESADFSQPIGFVSPNGLAGENEIDLSGKVLFDDRIEGVPIKIQLDRARVAFTPSIDVKAQIRLARLRRFEMIARGTVEAELDVRAIVGGRHQLSKEIDVNGPAPLFVQPFAFSIGPVPVVGEVQLDLFAGFELDAVAQGTATAGFDASAGVEVGAIYEGGAFQEVFVPSFDANAHPLEVEAEAGIRVKVHVRPELKTVFYRVGGPALDVVAFMEGNLVVLPPPPTATLSAGVSGNLAFRLDVMSFELARFDRELFEHRITLATKMIPSSCGNDMNDPGEVCPAGVRALATAPLPLALASGDFDGDGDIDLAAATAGGRTVDVFLNDGRAGFGERASTDVRDAPDAIAAADLDGDGDLDLVTANSDRGTVSVLRNEGGSFALDAVIEAGSDSARAVAAGDFDGDGKVELAVANWDAGTVSILADDGRGYEVVDTLPAGRAPEAVIAIDLDGDRDLDLAVASSEDHVVSIFLNDGRGTFGAPAAIATGESPESIVAADLDGDRDLDLATADRAAGTVTILENDGAGGFVRAATIEVTASPLGIAAADIDLDGDLDLATADAGSSMVSTLINSEAGFRRGRQVSAGAKARAIVIADLDGDRMPDLATADENDDSVSVILLSR